MAFLALTLSIFLILLAYELHQRLRYKLPPGPFPWPVIGNLRSLKSVSCQRFAEWAEAYGPIISARLGPRLYVVVSSPELAREVLKDNDQHLAHRPRNSSSASKYAKDGKDLIWADYGPHYVKLRKLSTLELFAPKSVAERFATIGEDEVASMVVSILKDCTKGESLGKNVTLRDYVGDAALNVVTRLALGKKFASADGSTGDKGAGLEFKAILADEAKLSASLATAENFPPWLRWTVVGLNESKYAKHELRKDRFARAMIAQDYDAKSNRSFADALMGLKEEQELSEDTVHGLIWNMINAGADTTAIAVEWAMAEVIRSPGVQRKAQEEVDNAVGRGRRVGESDLPNLPYLRCIVKEALRLHPPTPLMLPHAASAGVKVGGYDVPAGAIMHVNVWAMGRDEGVWGPDAASFRPERFLEEEVDVRGGDFRMLPFGSGRRMCPGARLGMSLVGVMVGQLVHQFGWTAAGEEEIDMGESPGLVCYMQTPLQAVAAPRLPY